MIVTLVYIIFCLDKIFYTDFKKEDIYSIIPYIIIKSLLGFIHV